MFLMPCEPGVEKFWISFGQGYNHCWIPVHDACGEIGLGESKGIPFYTLQVVVSRQLFVEMGSVAWHNDMLIL